MDRLTRTFTAERADDGRVTLSTETPCPQDGLILLSGGWDLSRFDKVAPKMFYNHSTSGSQDFPIGRWEDVQIKDGKLVAKPVFAAEEHPERAGVIAKLWDGGFLDDVSVSFRVDTSALGAPVKAEDGRTYQVSGKHELLECSVVGIGADPNAGKGRMAEAVARGVITEEEAESMSEKKTDASDATPTVSYEEFHALKTEVEKLREGLETARADIDRLHEERKQAEPPAPPAAAPEPEIAAPAPEDRMRELRAELERQIALKTGRIPD